MDRHPIRGLLDGVAARGGRPSQVELEELAADVTRRELGESAIGKSEVLLRVEKLVEQVASAKEGGEMQRARAIASEGAARLASELPEYQPVPESAGKSMSEIVERVRRV